MKPEKLCIISNKGQVIRNNIHKLFNKLYTNFYISKSYEYLNKISSVRQNLNKMSQIYINKHTKINILELFLPLLNLM